MSGSSYLNLLSDPCCISAEAQVLHRYGFRSAALFYLNKNEPLMKRASRVTHCSFEETELPEYTGTALYPHGQWRPALPEDDPHGHGLVLDRAGRYQFNPVRFQRFLDSIQDEREHNILSRVAQDMALYSARGMDSRYGHGGGHWVMDHERMLKEGLTGYRQRIEAAQAAGESPGFYDAMAQTLRGLTLLASRMKTFLQERAKQNPSPALTRLTQAYRRVPEQPAESFFDALVCVQFFMMYACVSEPGRMDHYLLPYYRRDLAAGQITETEAEVLLDELLANINTRVAPTGAWHLVLGGTGDGESDGYNELTHLLLKVMARYRQPNTSLRIRPEMPDCLWDQALDNLAGGIGNPALINDEVICRGLKKHVGVGDEDLVHLAFGGCTETVIAGKTHSETMASILNLPEILEQSIRSDLAGCSDFESFKQSLLNQLSMSIHELLNEITIKHRLWSVYRTDTVRSLLTTGCIEKGRGYHQGGPVYNFENTSVLGFANMINSLVTVRAAFGGELPVSAGALPAVVQANFEGHDQLLAAIGSLPKFGQGDQTVDGLAEELSAFIFNTLNTYRCPDGIWHLTPSIIGWTTFVHAGKHIGATPDGRKEGAAFADSSGPMQGTDSDGPTAVLLSASAIPQVDVTGTCVLNLMLSPKLFHTPADRAKLKQLIQSYFSLGGMHLQISVVDKAVLQAAQAHPEEHRNLIVRIAGYNDTFVDQRADIQEEILKRTQHGGRTI